MPKKFVLNLACLSDKWEKSPYFFSLLVMLFSFLTFICITTDVVTKERITYYDRIIVDFLNTIASKGSDTLAISITNLGSPGIIWVLSAIFITIALFYKCYKEILLLAFSVIPSAISMQILKAVVERTRPEIHTPIIFAGGYSYPSGHATSSMCYYGILIYLCFIFMKNRWFKFFSILFLSILILLIGFSRIYLGVHYPSDVLGGFFLGLFWVNVGVLVYRRQKVGVDKI